jgi:hypothetical protein
LARGPSAFAVLAGEGMALRKRMWSVYGPAIDDLFANHLTPAETELMRDVSIRILTAAKRGDGKTS